MTCFGHMVVSVWYFLCRCVFYLKYCKDHLQMLCIKRTKEKSQFAHH